MRVQVDGVNTTEGTGAAGFYYDYGSFDEVQLGNDGNDASAATPGVQLNAVIKSGGNQFRGDFYFDYENENLQSDNIDDRLRNLGHRDRHEDSQVLRPEFLGRRSDQARQVLVLRLVSRSEHGDDGARASRPTIRLNSSSRRGCRTAPTS